MSEGTDLRAFWTWLTENHARFEGSTHEREKAILDLRAMLRQIDESLELEVRRSVDRAFEMSILMHDAGSRLSAAFAPSDPAIPNWSIVGESVPGGRESLAFEYDAALSYRFRVVDVRDRSESLWELLWNERDMAGWNEIASGWSIGPLASGSAIEIDSPITSGSIGLFPAGHHSWTIWGPPPVDCEVLYCRSWLTRFSGDRWGWRKYLNRPGRLPVRNGIARVGHHIIQEEEGALQW